ncbi:Molybdopterin oxidoreductase subunitprotein [Myxococcus hansupus]|uniref:Molybdopterin oxidoreductase subunitprotein n=1 Tax=Pseudomyxococcus hansupus TaxID=1297742 RepID=A0A0H4WXR2_9BACT|nr:cytochrome c3 family protein [Myxococcus hansupus]AKQ66125.1 Molybdopterin oxidoreductase subunitprotein [Myxococcus hansupus]
MGLFPPATDGILRAVLGLMAVLPVALPVALLLLARNPLGTGAFEPVPQPVPFDHRHHVADEGIGCRYCHEGAWKGPFAGIPPTSRCMGCHAQIWNESEPLSLVRQSYFEDRPIPWNRVHRLPNYVFFNHAIHVHKGVGCVSCHGRVDQMARVEQVAPLTMGWCLECHRDPVPHLRPPERVADMTWRPPGAARDTGLLVMRTLDVSPRTECSTCHR